MSKNSRKDKTANRSSTYHPQPTPLYVTFAHPDSGEVQTGIILGWERVLFGDERVDAVMMPVVMPHDAHGSILDIVTLCPCCGPDVEVYETLDEAKAAMSRMTDSYALVQNGDVLPH